MYVYTDYTYIYIIYILVYTDAYEKHYRRKGASALSLKFCIHSLTINKFDLSRLNLRVHKDLVLRELFPPPKWTIN